MVRRPGFLLFVAPGSHSPLQSPLGCGRFGSMDDLSDVELKALAHALRAVKTDDQSHVLTYAEYRAAVDLEERVKSEISRRNKDIKPGNR